jgi:D-alanyl-D-alanine carboxypeptidase
LGWHIGKTHDTVYFFKEGGGGGFHSEMRIYPLAEPFSGKIGNIASVVMVNGTDFNSTKFLNFMDKGFLI